MSDRPFELLLREDAVMDKMKEEIATLKEQIEELCESISDCEYCNLYVEDECKLGKRGTK